MLIGLLALLTLAVVVGRLIGPGSRARFPSSFVGDAEGLLAFRRVLETLPRPVEILTRPYDELPAGPGLLIVATPLQRAVDAREETALRAWLDGGGALLVVDDAGITEQSHRLFTLLDDAGLSRQLPVVDLDPSTLLPERPAVTPARGAPVSPSGDDLATLRLHRDAGLLPDSDAIPLAYNDTPEVVAAEGRLGQARVVRVMGPLLANDRIALGDHLTFAMRLVDDLRDDGPVVFDEYHHGYGGMVSVVRNLDAAALMWVAASALIAAALYALARGIRFGPPRAVPEPPRRSSLEFVRSMASLYQRADARDHALEAMTQRVRREARQRWSIQPKAGTARLGLEIAQRSGVAHDRVLELMARAEGAGSRHRLDEREMVHRARALALLEEEVFGD